VRAGDVFLATGKHDLRGWKRPPGLQPDLVGFKLHWRLAAEEAAALAGMVELVLFPGGYAGLEPVEGGKANLCALVRRSKLAELGRTWDGLLAAMRSACPLLDRRLTGAEPCETRPLAISGLPYGYVRSCADGPWRLGDQAAVIPSFAGDGMSIALHSARLAAEHYLAGRTADDYQRALARDVAGQVRRATVLSQLAVRPWGQAVVAGAVRLAPGLMRKVARSTRIPEARLRARQEPGPSALARPHPAA
jgi:flavin-dependent dehydrogenase